MADRSVVVRLKADVASYQANLRKAQQSTAEFGREVSGQGKTARADVEAVGRSALVMGGAMALGMGKGIQIAAGFEKQMSGVRAVSGASAEEMTKLSDAALAAGASTKLAGVTASDAARAEAELVKAGVSVSDVLGGALMGSLTLAAAGQLDFADAATIAAQAMNIFDLKGGAVTHVADVLAAAANKSAADVGQLGDALRQGGLLAAQTGLTLEETVGTLAAFADNALIGSDAGTSLKTMLQRLTPTSEEAAGLMEELGFSAYDAQGNFIGLEGLAGELQSSLGGMTVEQRNLAMATLFGSDAVRAANILYAEGAEGMAEYVAAVDDAGAAARMAAIQNDNLSGDIEALGGAIESAIIENGSKANDMLRFLTQSATGLVTGFSSMPSGLQTVALGMGAVVTAGTLAIGVLGTMGPKVIQAKKALENMGKTGEFLAGHLKGMAGGLAVMGAGLAVFAAWETVLGKARAEAEEWAAAWEPTAMNTAKDGMASFAAEFENVRTQQKRMSDEANSGSAPWDRDKREQLRTGARELQGIGNEMARMIDISAALSREFGISQDSALSFVTSQRDAGVDVLAEDYDSVYLAMGNTFLGMKQGTVDTQNLGAATETLGSEITSVEDQVEAFGEALDALYNQFFGVESAQDAFQSSINELPDVLKAAAEEGLSLNDVLTGQSDSAISVREHMRGMVSDASDLIAEWQEQGVQGEELQARIDYLSGSFRNQAEAAGLPGPVVDHYLGLLAAIPVEKTTTVNANTAGAVTAIDMVLTKIGQVPKNLPVNFIGPTLPGQVRSVQPSTGGLIPAYLAAGGVPVGYGPRGTDTIPAWLTPGEFVMQKSAVDRFGVGFMESLNAGSLMGGSSSSYAFAPNIVVHAGSGADGRAIGAAIVDSLADWARSNGPLPASIVG